MYLLTGFLPKPAISLQSSPFHACDCTHDRITSLMHVKKKHVPFLFMTLIVWDIGTEKMKERTKTSNLVVDEFFV